MSGKTRRNELLPVAEAGRWTAWRSHVNGSSCVRSSGRRKHTRRHTMGAAKLSAAAPRQERRGALRQEQRGAPRQRAEWC